MGSEMCIRDRYGSFEAEACANIASSRCSSSTDGSESGGENSQTEVRTVSRGSRPKDLQTWVGDNFAPVPIKLKLQLISKLLTENNLAKSSEYGLDRNLDSQGLKKLLEDGNRNYYCTDILGLTKQECQTEVQGCGLSDACEWGQICKNGDNGIIECHEPGN